MQRLMKLLLRDTGAGFCVSLTYLRGIMRLSGRITCIFCVFTAVSVTASGKDYLHDQRLDYLLHLPKAKFIDLVTHQPHYKMMQDFYDLANLYLYNNEYKYEMKLERGNKEYYKENNMNGINARFIISKCENNKCFLIEGQLNFKITQRTSAYGEIEIPTGTYSVPDTQCTLRIEDAPVEAIDAENRWAVTLVSNRSDGNGCASLPPDMAGIYK